MTEKMKSFVKGIMAGLVSDARMPKGEPAELEALFEGEYEVSGTQSNMTSMGRSDTILTAGDVLRVTVDGAATTEQVTAWSGYFYVGNGWLYASGTESDDGTDWVVVMSTGFDAMNGFKEYGAYSFNHKTAGKHTVKIERLVK